MSTPFPNRYKGTCLTCRTDVAPQAGVTVRIDGRYSVFCSEHAPAMPSKAAADPTIELKMVGGEIQIRPMDYLGSELFDRFRTATGGTDYRKEAKANYATVEAVGAVTSRLAAAGFKLNASPEVTAAVQAWEARASADTSAASERAIEIDAKLRERGLALFPFQAEGVQWMAHRRALVLADEMGLGKAQPVDATVLCPGGWRRIGELAPGDSVIGSNGKSCKVTGVFPQGIKRVYRATFSDGATAECCSEHLWFVQTPLQRSREGRGRVLSLGEIAGSLKDKAGNRRHFIPMVKPVEFDIIGDLPIDPYALGVLLGDGGFTAGSCILTNCDSAVVSLVANRLAPFGVQLVNSDRTSWRINGPGSGKANPLIAALRGLNLWGCLSIEKFIPSVYMHASVHDRIELMRGLLDTDGSPRDDSRTIEYTSSSKELALGVKSLCESLGMSVRISSRIPRYTHNGETRIGHESWRLNINPGSEIVPFHRPSKLEKWASGPRHKYIATRSFMSVDYVGDRECVCIAVDAPDHLYVTTDFVVTHNTIQALTAAPAGTPILVVCPKVAKGVWQREAARWRPDLRVTVLSGRGSFRWPAPGEMVVVNYELLPDPPLGKTERAAWEKELARLEMLVAGGQSEHTKRALEISKDLRSDDASIAVMATCPENTCVIADEAHALKGGSGKTGSKRGKAFKGLCSRAQELSGRGWLVTGSPFLNRPTEIWNLLGMIGAQNVVFGSYKRFKYLCGGADGRYGTNWSAGGINSDVAIRLREVMLRRLKSDVLDQLPSKIVEIESVELDSKTLKALDKIQAELAARGIDLNQAIASAKSNSSIAFEEIARARALLATAKGAFAMEIADELEAADEPALVFSAHRAPIEVFASRPGWAVITGDTSEAERTSIAERFQAGVLKGVAGTIQACGVAITLTRAAQVIFVDALWTPELNRQAEDRAHRIGQSRTVHIRYLVADHPIDQRVMELCEVKRAMAARMVDAAAIKQGALPGRADAAAALESARASDDVAQRQRDADALADRVRAERAAADGRSNEARALAKSENANRNRGLGIDPALFDKPRREPVTRTEEWALEALEKLASMDGDRASELNYMGFSQADTHLGCAMAKVARVSGLSDGEWLVAIAVCRRYPRQVGRPEGSTHDTDVETQPTHEA